MFSYHLWREKWSNFVCVCAQLDNYIQSMASLIDQQCYVMSPGWSCGQLFAGLATPGSQVFSKRHSRFPQKKKKKKSSLIVTEVVNKLYTSSRAKVSVIISNVDFQCRHLENWRSIIFSLSFPTIKSCPKKTNFENKIISGPIKMSGRSSVYKAK